ncbi:MAG: hypothetical protein H7330_04025 [Hymenobacteraceae bacterium]|nr:hypothetical protein [Hymenobacteraceae bacterium]
MLSLAYDCDFSLLHYCQSTDVIRNGKNAAGNAKFRCKGCNSKLRLAFSPPTFGSNSSR